MNPNFFHQNINRPPPVIQSIMPPVNQQHSNNQPMLTPVNSMSNMSSNISSISGAYPPLSTTAYPLNNQMQYYNQSYFPPSPFYQQQLINYSTRNYMQYYQHLNQSHLNQSNLNQSHLNQSNLNQTHLNQSPKAYQLPTSSPIQPLSTNLNMPLNTNSPIKNDLIKPVPPPDIKPPPPPIEKIPLPQSTSKPQKLISSPKIDEFDSLINKFPIIPMNSSTNSISSTKSTVTMSNENSKTDTINSARPQHSRIANLNEFNSIIDSQSNRKCMDQFENTVNSSSTVQNSINNPINNVINNNLSNIPYSNPSTIQSFDNSTYNTSYSLDNSTMTATIQPPKRQKMDIKDFDENKIKSQLEQINQLKQEQLKENSNNLMNKSQNLFTEADEHWLKLLNPEQKKIIDFLKEQQKNFEDIYKNWEDDYKEWRSKNITILDFTSYQNNLKEWEDWKTNLLQRKVKLNQTCQERIDGLKKQILGDKYESSNVDTSSKSSSSIKDFDSTQDTDSKQDCISDEQSINKIDNEIDNYDSQNNDDYDYPVEQPQEDEHPFVLNDKPYLDDEPLVNSNKLTYVEPQQQSNPTVLFPSSQTILQKKKEEQIKQMRIDDACKMFDYINETREVLNIIDRLDFKQQQDRINFNNQLETIKKTIEHQLPHSDSEEENLDTFSKEDQLIPQTEMVGSFDLNSVLNKVKQIKNSASTKESTNIQLQNDQQFQNNLITQPQKLNQSFNFLQSNAHHQQIIQQDQQASQPKQPTIDNDFLSKLGIDLSSTNRVLSYKDLDYFLKPPSFTLNAEDLFELPSREYRPTHLCIILRGMPSTGKSTFIDLICKEEIKHRSRLPRIFNFNDYLINQRKINELLDTSIVIENCKKNLFEDFSKVIKENQFNFVIFNSINQKFADFDHFYIIAKLNGYSTYIAEMDFIDYTDITDEATINELSYSDWCELSTNWELAPASYIRLKTKNFIYNRMNDRFDNSIQESDNFSVLSHNSMNLPVSHNMIKNLIGIDDNEFDISKETFLNKINWNDGLAFHKLDDHRMKLKRPNDEYYQLPDNYYKRKYDNKKRVRWLDIELKE